MGQSQRQSQSFVPYLHHPLTPIPTRNIPPHLIVISRENNKRRSNNKDNKNKPGESKNNKKHLKTTRGMPTPPHRLNYISPLPFRLTRTRAHLERTRSKGENPLRT